MFEIRSYHYDPTKFEAYKKWAINDAAPFLKANLKLAGFWLDNGTPPELSGSDPMDLKHGTANVTWIIEWASIDERAEKFGQVMGGEEWQAIWARHPDADGYLQMEARFAEAV